MEDTAENSDNLGVSNTETEVNNDNVDCEGTQDNALMAPVSEEVIGGENDTVVTSSAVSETPTSAPKELYGFDTEPMRCSGAWTEFYSPQHNTTKNNFLKGCKWSPDGLCVLTASDDNCSRIFELPQVFYESESADGSQPAEMKPALRIQESDTIYDYQWYPLLNSMDSSTCCFVTSSRHNPIHLWDAFTGQLRATYRAFNHLDEIAPALSVAFHPHGQTLYCGFEHMLRIFDVEYPGRQCTELSLKACGQSGIISTIAFHPSSQAIFAAGSYRRTIGVYSENDGSQLFVLEGQTGGVTQLMFSPDGDYLYSSGRKDCEILCWDLRNPGKVLHSLFRENYTNQRMYFDISSSGRYLISGSSIGNVYVWDTTSPAVNKNDIATLEPVRSFQAHNDCVNGVSFNPIYPIFASSSGQRKFSEPPNDDDDDDCDVLIADHISLDNSLMLWWSGGQKQLAND